MKRRIHKCVPGTGQGARIKESDGGQSSNEGMPGGEIGGSEEGGLGDVGYGGEKELSVEVCVYMRVNIYMYECVWGVECECVSVYVYTYRCMCAWPAAREREIDGQMGMRSGVHPTQRESAGMLGTGG